MAVAGIDRWRGGWVIAELSTTRVTLWTAKHIADACDRLATHEAVAIDMPIALAPRGTRSAEAEIRSVLGSSARSVFTSPTRAAVVAESQRAATDINRAHEGPGISAQAFGLFASICELRATLDGPGFAHWWETHPETSFALMNDGPPLASKRTAGGVGQRLEQIARHLGLNHQVLLDAPDKVPVDDVLDAIASAWSARRIAAGTAALFGDPGRDDQGFPVGIRV